MSTSHRNRPGHEQPSDQNQPTTDQAHELTFRDVNLTGVRHGHPHQHTANGTDLVLLGRDHLRNLLAEVAYIDVHVTKATTTTGTTTWRVELPELSISSTSPSLAGAAASLVPGLRHHLTHTAAGTTSTERARGGEDNAAVRLLWAICTDAELSTWLADLAHSHHVAQSLLTRSRNGQAHHEPTLTKETDANTGTEVTHQPTARPPRTQPWDPRTH